MKKYIFQFILLGITLCTINAQVDRSKAPQPGPASKVQIGDYTKIELPNGLKVFVIEDHRIPRVSFSLSLIITPELEGANSGIGSLTSELIGTGTKKRTKDQINEETDFISASLNASPQGIYASSLKKHTPKLLDLLSDITMNSVFTSEELEKSRTQMLSGLASEKDDPNSIAGNVSSAIVYGKEHPYGEFETEASVKNITLDMCNQYYSKYFNPNVAYLSVVGDITPKEAKKLVTQYFGSWKKNEVAVKTYAKPVTPAKSKVILVDRPEAVQSVINICYPVDLNLANPDYVKASVANTVLGGGIFRLFINLREKHAYTYGAYSRISANPLASSFKASTSTRNQVTDSAIIQIMYEMNRLRTEPVPAEELQMVKNYLSGNFALSLENPQTVASFAVNTERYGLPKDFYTNYLKNIETVTAADVQAMAQKYVLPDQSNILVVGKASEIAETLKKFSANGKIEYYDADANAYDPAKRKKPIPEGVTLQQVFDKYIKAIGGKENIEKVKDLTMKAGFTVQGMKLSANFAYKIPDMYMNEVTTDGHLIEKQIYNHGKGKAAGVQGNRELEGAELEQMKVEAALFPELKYQEWQFVAELKEIVIANGEDSYLVEIKSKTGNVSQDYYSVNTGLKVQNISMVDTPMGKLTKTSLFSNYEETNGIMLPKKLSQSAGSQSFDIIVESISINSGVKDEIFN